MMAPSGATCHHLRQIAGTDIGGVTNTAQDLLDTSVTIGYPGNRKDIPPGRHYPSALEYYSALSSSACALIYSPLRQARLATDSFGLPLAAVGSTAIIFLAQIGSYSYALRFYTRANRSSRERYEEFDTYISSHHLTGYAQSVAWFEDALRLGGQTWPVLQMEWIEGQMLDVHIERLARNGNIDQLATLARKWRKLVCTLQDAKFAHGDLSHSNVIVDKNGRLQLVDFDSVWIPPLREQPQPTDVGHRNYQHPGRMAGIGWGPWMDTFPGLVIYISLVALAKAPSLWQQLHNGENLLFTHQDFYPPFQTTAWRCLAEVEDAEVHRLADTLKACCAPNWAATRSMEYTIR